MKLLNKLMALAAPMVLAAGLTTPQQSQAQASDPYIGQLMLIGFNFCPRGWAAAEGQLLPIASSWFKKPM